MKTIAFTGKRPQGLPWRFNEQDERCIQLKQRLAAEIENRIKEGYTAFISGMALGIDIIAAEIVLEIKTNTHRSSWKLHFPVKIRQTNGALQTVTVISIFFRSVTRLHILAKATRLTV